MNDPALSSEARLAAAICRADPEFAAGELAIAARHLADLVGVAIAAADEPALAAVCAMMAPAADGARLWGTGRRFRLRDAALLNAFAGHFHDFDDDETELAMAHVTVSAGTAAAVMADRDRTLSGAAVLGAYLIGAETAMCLGRLVNPGHYRAGHHATATLGVFAATAAAGRLAGLPAEAMRRALGFAAAFSSGLRATFGSAAKPLQVARAVESGILAVACAAGGLDSTPGSLFGPAGWTALAGGRRDAVEAAIAGFGPPWDFFAGGMTLKAHPCCTASHSAVAALLDLCRQLDPPPAAIACIVCTVDPAVPSILIHDRPASPGEAKFSLPYALAAAAVFRRLGLAEFAPAALADPRVAALAGRVEVRLADDLPKGPSGVSVAARVRLVLADGGAREAFCPAVPGSAGNPLSEAAVAAKFVACAGGHLGPERARAAFARLAGCAGEPSFAAVLDDLAVATGAAGPGNRSAIGKVGP